MGPSFEDHFSTGAASYGAFRPRYPAALFAALAAAAPARRLAWDCATGSGQAAAGLAPWFVRVVATDASPRQLAAADGGAGATYVAAAAEACPLGEGTADLVTVAQALHWLDLEAFYGEVERVLRPGGLVAAWSYGLLRVTPPVDAVVDRLYGELAGAYWPPARRHVETGYRDLPFPFVPLDLTPPAMTARWDLRQLMGYLGTWSAVRRCREATGGDPLAVVSAPLARAWGDPARRRTVRWPLTVRLGRRAPRP